MKKLEALVQAYSQKNHEKELFTTSQSGVPEYRVMSNPIRYVYILTKINDIQMMIDVDLIPSLYIGKTRSSRMGVSITSPVPLSTLQKAVRFLRC